MADETKVCCSLFGLFQRLLIPLARQIYAVSQPFEIKAQGASYPVSTATPSAGATAGTATSTSTGSGSSSTGSSKANGAFATFEVSAAGVLAAIGAAIGML